MFIDLSHTNLYYLFKFSILCYREAGYLYNFTYSVSTTRDYLRYGTNISAIFQLPYL